MILYRLHRMARPGRCIGFLLLLVLLFAFGVEAASTIEGTVVSVQPKSGRFTLLQSGTMRVVEVLAPSGKLSGVVAKGAYLRIWGDFLQSDPSLFRALKMVGNGSAPKGRDPTGVRFRLNRGKRAP